MFQIVPFRTLFRLVSKFNVNLPLFSSQAEDLILNAHEKTYKQTREVDERCLRRMVEDPLLLSPRTSPVPETPAKTPSSSWTRDCRSRLSSRLTRRRRTVPKVSVKKPHRFSFPSSNSPTKSKSVLMSPIRTFFSSRTELTDTSHLCHRPRSQSLHQQSSSDSHRIVDGISLRVEKPSDCASSSPELPPFGFIEESVLDECNLSQSDRYFIRFGKFAPVCSDRLLLPETVC